MTRHPRAGIIAGTCAAVFFFSATAPAQGLRLPRVFLGRFEANLKTFSSFSRIDTKTPASRQTNENLLTQQELGLRTRGAYVLDPRLIELSLGTTLGLRQERSRSETSGVSSSDDSGNGSLLGYDVFTRILPGKRYALDLFANRTQSSQSRELGGQTDLTTRNWGGTLFGNWLYIPSSLTFRDESQNAESRTGAVVTRVDERRRTVAYEGRRGWENREVVLEYEFIDKTDDVFSDLGFRDHVGTVSSTVDFGPELDRRWSSRVSGAWRTGFSAERRVDLDEQISIDHSDRLRTQYRYDLNYTDRRGNTTTVQRAAFDLVHRLYSSLTTRATLDGARNRTQGGDRDRYRGALGIDYTKRLPSNGRLNLALGGALELEDDRFDTVESFVSRERHTFAAPFASTVALDRRFAVPASIEVTKTSGTPDPACGAFSLPRPLVEGRDYLVRGVGNLTEIVPIPCTAGTPGINPGDAVTVDYRVRVSPSVRFSTASWNADGSIDYGWVRPFFSYESRNQELLSGRDDGFLNDQSSSRVGIEVSHDGTRVRLRGRIEVEHFDSRDQAYETLRTSQGAAITIQPTVRLNLHAEQMTREFSSPEGRKTTAERLEANLRSSSFANLVLEAFVRLRSFGDTLVPDEKTKESGVRARWHFGKLDVTGVVRFIDRRRGLTETEDLSGQLRVLRRF